MLDYLVEEPYFFLAGKTGAVAASVRVRLSKIDAASIGLKLLAIYLLKGLDYSHSVVCVRRIKGLLSRI